MQNNIRVNLFGHFFYTLGISEACRNMVKCFDKINMEYSLIHIDLGRKRIYKEWESKVKNNYRKDFEINIFFVQPDIVRIVFAKNKDLVDSIKNKYKIAFWAHEMEEFPRNDFLSNMFDEIWTPSNFVKDAVSKVTNKPVFNAKHAIDANRKINILNMDHFKLPKDAFLFLSMHCPLSLDSRKNPLGPIKAFKAAFDKNDMQVGLIVKVNSGRDSKLLHQSLQSIISEKEDYNNIYLINQELTEQEMHSLLNSSDALVSLHRSEGFGLPPAEALSLGKAVISTDWSATREFLNLSNSLPVNYTLRKIKELSGLSQSANAWEASAVDNLFWADPDISHAAELMKKIRNDRNLYDYISKNGKKTIEDFYSVEAVSKLLENRLVAIRGKLKITENPDGIIKVVIPHFGDNALLGAAIEAATQNPQISLDDIIAIDNNGNNQYFSKAVNVGVKQALAAGADYIWLLNNDTKPQSDYLTHSLNRFKQNPNTGIVGGKNLKWDEPDIIYWGGSTLNNQCRTGHKMGYVSKGHLDVPTREPWATFSSVLIKADVFRKIGLLDESMVHYCSDVDFSLRTIEAKYEIWYEPKSITLHKVAASAGKGDPVLRSITIKDEAVLNNKWVHRLQQSASVANPAPHQNT